MTNVAKSFIYHQDLRDTYKTYKDPAQTDLTVKTVIRYLQIEGVSIGTRKERNVGYRINRISLQLKINSCQLADVSGETTSDLAFKNCLFLLKVWRRTPQDIAIEQHKP